MFIRLCYVNSVLLGESRAWLLRRRGGNIRLSIGRFLAAAHTAYKMALFAWPPMAICIDYPFVAVCTLTVGILFGLTRELSGSVIPAALGHMAFDLIVYGTAASAPWWVWI